MRVARKFPMVVKVGAIAVKVYRSIDRGRYEKFTVPDYSNGKRRLRQFSDLTSARNEAERLANLLARGEASAASLGPSERASFGRAVELLQPTGDTLELACARYASAVAILRHGDLIETAAREFARRHPVTRQARSIRSVCDELLENREKRRASRRYLDDLRNRLGRFCEAFGQALITSVGTADVQHWLDGLGLAPQSLINYRRVLVTLFEFAEARGYIPKAENPALDCEAPKVRRHDVDIYSPDELRRLLDAAPTEYLPCLAIGALAGLRSAEIQRLTWDSIDLQRGFIKVAAGKAKTGSRRLVPICDSLKAWLTRDAKPSGPIWSRSHDDFYAAQKVTAMATGDQGKSPVKWKANGLRHSFASYRLAATSDAAKVAHEMGNSPSVVHSHYAELVTPDEAKQWFDVCPDPEK